jgi:hypothetical protein
MISATLRTRILEEVLPLLPKAKESIKDMKTNASYIKIPIEIDGVIDVLVWSTTLEKFTSVEILVYTDETETETRIERIML